MKLRIKLEGDPDKTSYKDLIKTYSYLISSHVFDPAELCLLKN